VPAHRISQSVVHVEQVGDVDGLSQSLPADSGVQGGPGVVWTQRLRLQCHLAQEAQRLLQPGVNRRRLEVIEDPLRQFFVKGKCRDRGVSIGSKETLVEPRYEGGKQLAFADRPRRRPAHDRLGVCAVRRAEEGFAITQGPDDIRRTKARRHANYGVEQTVAEMLAPFDSFQSQALSNAASAASSRCSEAPTAAATISSNSCSSL